MRVVRRRPAVLLGLLLPTLVAGCFGEGQQGGPGAVAFPAGVHPWPAADGSEWPVAGGAALAGPFQKLPTERALVTAPDGTDINVFVVRPALPEGVKAPAVLWSSPYWGTTQEAGDDPALWDNSWEGEAVPVNLLVESGFAVGIMNLRGSGPSGGCFVMFGQEDWEDTAMVADWLGEQDWSNGRVGIMGLSYHGTTPWQAATRDPGHVKTIVTAGMIHNLYTFFHSDQGAAQAAGPSFGHIIFGLTATVPKGEPPQRIAGEWVLRASERFCPESAKVLTELYTADYGDVRDEAFWEERRIIKDFDQITASVLMTHGLRDLTGHAVQEDPVWAALPEAVPRRAILGQYGHMFPNFDESWTGTREDWNSGVLLPWLDFWLKGVGDPATLKLGVAEYQDDAEAWHESAAWPPAEAHAETLHLCAGADIGLARDACESASGSFVSQQGSATVDELVCGTPPAPSPPADPRAILFVSEVLDEPVLLAGNPFAYVELESTQPGGLLSLDLYELEGSVGEGGCSLRQMAFGGADLRHHAGNYVGANFPVLSPTPVRVDLTNLAEAVAAGNRLVLVASYSEAARYEAVPYSPVLTIHGGSHLVLPVVEGTLGGGAPPLAEYPPRPFVSTE